MTLPELKRARLPRADQHRLARRRRHARAADPALDHHDRLRRVRERLDRAPVPRRRAAGPDADGAVHGYIVVWALLNTQKMPPPEPPLPFAEKFKRLRQLLPTVLLIVAVHRLDLHRRRDRYRGRGARRRRVAARCLRRPGSADLVELHGQPLRRDAHLLHDRLILAGAAFLALAMGYIGMPRALAELDRHAWACRPTG